MPIALLVEDHVHHAAAENRLTEYDGDIATCPIREASYVWPDGPQSTEVAMTGVIGHRQVTDAYPAALARSHDGRPATFDQGLAKPHPDVTELVPV
ncbi:hypothetical protein [Stackebrandtia albiflava]|uniref:hypothetical protein n=1 Tax=Stackebrandtia albiflava TaxID=406432 RepID=UPI001FCE6F81|nr:hypothetical protein [Stackebrandtia albiflava]